MMAAAILTHEKTELCGCPRLSDIDDMGSILQTLGCRVSRGKDTLLIDPGPQVPEALAELIGAELVDLIV